MTLYLMNPRFELVRVIEGYKTSIWTERYDADGDALLVFPLKYAAPADYPKNHYLYHDESVELMQIKQTHVKTEVGGERLLEVHAASISGILKQRLAWGTNNLNSGLESAVKTLLDKNLLAPTDTNRKIENFRFSGIGAAMPSTYRVEAQIVDKNLHSAIRELCSEFDVGFSVRMLSNGIFTFQLQVGTDRSYRQETNPYVVFSPEFDNLEEASLIQNHTDFRNVVRVGGEGSGTDKKFRTVEIGSPRGLDRYEGYHDAASLSSDNGAVSASAYNAYLDREGRVYLNDHADKIVFDGEASKDVADGYGVNYNLGDIVQIDDDDLITSPARIVEYIRSDDDQNGLQNFPALRAIN